MKYTVMAILLLVSTAFGNRAFTHRIIANNAFTYGEKIEFRVHYGFVNAGYGSFEVAQKPEYIDGREHYRITGKGRSASSFDWFYKVRDEYVTYMDKESLSPRRYQKQQEEGSYKDKDQVEFDQKNKKLKGTKGELDMPQYTQDIVSLAYYARCTPVSKLITGATFPIDFYLDGKIYHISLKVLGREEIKTEVGRFKAIKIRPQVIADRVFKDEESMTLWVSDDANLLPLRIQADLLVGSIKVDISKYSGVRNPTYAWIPEK